MLCLQAKRLTCFYSTAWLPQISTFICYLWQIWLDICKVKHSYQCKLATARYKRYLMRWERQIKGGNNLSVGVKTVHRGYVSWHDKKKKREGRIVSEHTAEMKRGWTFPWVNYPDTIRTLDRLLKSMIMCAEKLAFTVMWGLLQTIYWYIYLSVRCNLNQEQHWNFQSLLK